MTNRSTAVDFLSSDGVALYGTQVVPDAPPRALILFVHGITSDRSEWGVFDKAANFFATQGCASLRFDYRGHGKSQCSPEKLTLKGIENDIVAAWSLLQPQAQSVNCFIVGSSFGGGLAYHAASKIGGFSRAFLLAPVFDYSQDIKAAAQDWTLDVDKNGYIQYSCLRLSPAIVSEADAFESIPSDAGLPATIFHGTKDDDVPIASSRTVAARYSSMELIEIDGAGHVIAAPGDLDMEDEQSWVFVTQVLAQMADRMQLGGQ